MKKPSGSARLLLIADKETDVCFVLFYFCFIFRQDNVVTPKHILEWQNTKQKHKKKILSYLYSLLFEVKGDINIYLHVYANRRSP